AILSGPLILAAVIAAASPGPALIVVALLTAAGTLGFAASLSAAPQRRAPAPRAERGRVLRTGGMRSVLLISLWLRGVSGALEVAAPTFATAHGAPAAAGLLIAALSVGGIAGAAFYGSRRWHAEPHRRLLTLFALLTACLTIAVAAPTIAVLGALLLL